jgi:hypothetical protein
MKTKNERTKHLKFIYGLMLLALIVALFLASCTSEDVVPETENAVFEKPILAEEAQFITKYFLGDEVKVRLEEDGTYSLAGSDARLFEEQLSDTVENFDENPNPEENLSALGLGGGIRKWTNSTIVYTISGLSGSVRSELQKSFDEWSSKTNIRFKERTNEADYITISSSGSNSNSGVATLGMNGSRGFIRLGTRATAVVIIHEIGHTLGYIHEQNRSDRDSYVRINFDNIQDNAVDQFFKSNSASLVTSQLDINSTMMYGSFTFSKNGRPTITDLNGNLLPQRQARISSLDIAGTNAIYPSEVDGTDTDACSAAEPWSPNTRYFVGDQVTYRGRLYERDFTRWNFIKNCG